MVLYCSRLATIIIITIADHAISFYLSDCRLSWFSDWRRLSWFLVRSGVDYLGSHSSFGVVLILDNTSYIFICNAK